MPRTWPSIAAHCVAAVLFYANSCTPAPAQSSLPASIAAEPSEKAAIYVVRRGWHVDIDLAADDLAPPLDALSIMFPGVKFLSFGFGDRRYLLAKHRGAPSLIAALWPGDALILATGLNMSPRAVFGDEHVTVLPASNWQVAAAEAFIINSFDKESAPAEGGLFVFAPGPYAGSVFFGARERYSAAHTCNTWVAELLKSAGYPIHSRDVLFAGQLWRRVKKLAAEHTQRQVDTIP